MKQIVVRKPGGFDRLVLEESADPSPGPGEVLVETRAVGVNFADVVVRLGLYKSAQQYVGWPITPGFEFSGVVKSVGEGVTDLAPGEAVFGVTRFGGYSSQIVAPRGRLFRKPAALDFSQAATFPTVFLTAYYALREAVRLRPGAKVLIHAAAGGVGLAALQLVRAEGALPYGIVGSVAKREVAERYGAAAVIDRERQDLWAEARRHAPNGFDVVLESNGAETLRPSYEALRPTGRLVVYGFHGMLRRGRARVSWLKAAWGYLQTPRFNPLDMVDDNKGVIAFNLSYLFEEQQLLEEAMSKLLSELEQGKLMPLPVQELPLADAGEAHRALQGGATVGKLALLP